MSTDIAQLACTYAALLYDDGQDITDIFFCNLDR